MTTDIAGAAGFSAARLARLSAAMLRYVDAGKIAGIVTALARHGQALPCGVHGMADIDAGHPMQEDTIFRIYSMSKPITSVAALMLFEQGALRLTDPVARFLPAFAEMQVLEDPASGGETRPARQPITVHHLLTHTAGLTYGFDTQFYLDRLYREQVWPRWESDPDVTLTEFVNNIAAQPLAEEPGTRFRYSVATDVLGSVVEAASGMPLAEFFQTQIFGPLGMTDTGFVVPPGKISRFAANYGPPQDGRPAVIDVASSRAGQVAVPGLQVIDAPGSSRYARSTRSPSGGGGLLSTAPDYLRFARMLLGRGELDGARLLGRKTVALMTMNHLPPGERPFGDPARGFGLGVSVLEDVARARSLGSVGNFGWGGAANTNFWVDPLEDMTCVLMLQFMPSDTYPVIADFHTGVYQAIAD